MTGDSVSQPIIIRVPLVVYGKPTGNKRRKPPFIKKYYLIYK